MCDPLTWLDVDESTDDAQHAYLRTLIGAHPLPYPAPAPDPRRY